MNVLKALFNGFSRNVACDDSGVLRTNIVVENIALSPSTDGVTIYGTTNGINRTMIVTDEFGKLQTTDTDLNSKITASNTNLININTSVVQKSDLINGSIVATNGKLDGIKGVLEAEKTVLDNTLNAINNNVLRATFNGFSRNVACDDNGVLKSNIVVENIYCFDSA